MKNSTYKKDRPQLSEDQILKNKDFKTTLNKVKPNNPGYLKSIKYWGAGGIATVIIVAGLYLLTNDQTNLQKESNNAEFTYKPNEGNNKIPAIKPPFAEHDIEYEIFKINTSKDEDIITKSGTKFHVTKNSMVDSAGNNISGIVEIHYRELRNPVDFFLSGIPMDYDSAGKRYVFESAGMLEIKAFQNNQPVALASNKTIDFEFNSTTDEPDFNFYSLNEETGIWSLENQAIPVKKINNGKATVNTKKHLINDNSNHLAELKPIEPIKQNKTKYSLNLAVNKDKYPELEKYEGTIFEINEVNQKFDPLIYKIQWEDAALSDSKINGNYTLKLTREDSSIYLTVYPVIKDKYYDKAIAQYKNELASYQANIKSNYDEFDDHQTLTNYEEIASINNDIIRVFSISNYGIYNCDCPRMQPNALARKDVINSTGQKIELGNYYVANIKRNMLVSIYANQTKGVKYYKNAPTVVWFVDEYGLISIIHPDQFTNLSTINQLRFDVFPTDQGIKMLRELTQS